MFANTIRELTLTGPVANYAFPDITGGVYQDDVSFLATARALLIPRNGKLDINHWNHTQYDAGDGSDEEYAAYLTDVCAVKPDQLKIVNVTGPGDRFAAIMKNHAETILPGYEYQELASKRMSVFCGAPEGEEKVWIYINSAERKSLVVSRNITMMTWHSIESAFSMFVPWLFEQRPNADELQMLLALVDPKKNSQDYIDAVEKLSAQFDLQRAAKEFYLKGFEQEAALIQKQDIRYKIDNCMDHIRTYTTALQGEYDKKAGYDAILSALENATGEERHELMDYFLSNPKLYVKEVQNHCISYFVGGYCDNWDPDNFESCFNNKQSVIFTAFSDNRGGLIESKDDYELLLKAIFVDEKIKIKMVSAWKCGYGCGIRPISDATYPAQFEDYLPNPHLHHYGCMGSFERDLNKAANEHNYVMAVDITSYENGNINWVDSIVVPEFMRDLITTRKKCFELPDGASVTNTEAVAWLKAQAVADEA